MDHTLLLVLITGVLSAVGGVGLWTFLAKWLEIGAKREAAEIVRLREDVSAAQLAHAGCESRLEEVERRMETVEAHHHSYMARWIKDASKRLVWVNSPALLSIFAPLGYSRNDIIGRTFAELLDADAVRQIDLLDRDALALPGTAVSTLVQLHPSLPKMVVVKVAGAGRDGDVIYEGYAYCENNPRQALARGRRRAEEQHGASAIRTAGQHSAGAGRSPA